MDNKQNETRLLIDFLDQIIFINGQFKYSNDIPLFVQYFSLYIIKIFFEALLSFSLPHSMSQSIVEESSSYSTVSYPEPCCQRQIILDVYSTSIYKDPILLNTDTNCMKKQVTLFYDSFILAHKQSNWLVLQNIDSRIKVTKRKRQVAKLLQDGFEIVAEVKFHKKENEKYTFSLERNVSPQNCDPYFQKLLSSNNQKNISNLVFYLVKSDKEFSESQLIKDDSYIKLGKQVYHTRVYTENDKMVKLVQQSKTILRKAYCDKNNNTIECKVCLVNEGQSKKDYLISPCKCAGSCSAIHVECLKSWISQKIQVAKADQKLRTYDLNRFACEICKQSYPQIIQIEDSLLDMVPQMKLETETLVLKRVSPIELNKQYSHFINLEKGKSLSIGRHYVNELILDEMSISRGHAAIYRGTKDKGFYLEDRQSRFGTFLSLREPINNFKEAVLINSKLTFRLRLVENEASTFSASSLEKGNITQEEIQY